MKILKILDLLCVPTLSGGNNYAALQACVTGLTVREGKYL
jgi:hypothetical protein